MFTYIYCFNSFYNSFLYFLFSVVNCFVGPDWAKLQDINLLNKGKGASLNKSVLENKESSLLTNGFSFPFPLSSQNVCKERLDIH